MKSPLLAIVVAWSLCSAPALAKPNALLLLPSEQPATSQWLSWHTSQVASAQQVQWRAVAAPQHTQQRSADRVKRTSALGGAHWRAELQPLQPATSYQYRVGMAEQWSEWQSFTTAAALFKPFQVIYVGDAQNAVASAVTPLFNRAFLQSPAAQLVLHAGDLIDRNTPTVQAWQEWFEALGKTGARINQLVTPGNHEYQVDTQQQKAHLAAEFDAFFAVKRQQAAPFNPHVFSILYQGVQFISLDTTALLHDRQQAAAQAAWLEQQLSTTPANWRVVLMHHPVYTFAAKRQQSRDPLLAERLQSIFERYQVDLVLQGHDHLYSRLHHNKVTYLVSIAGPKMNALSAAATEMTSKSLADTQLFQLLHFSEQQIRVEVFDLAGQLRDSFEINK